MFAPIGDSMNNFGSGSVDRISATKASKLLMMLPRALRFLLLFCAFAPRREQRRKSLRKTGRSAGAALGGARCGCLARRLLPNREGKFAFKYFRVDDGRWLHRLNDRAPKLRQLAASFAGGRDPLIGQ